MDHIKSSLARHQNIILNGFDPVSSQGFTQVPNFILKSKHLSVGAKLTYAMLLSYAWQNDFSFPGQEKLAEDMGSGKRSVVRYIDELAKNGAVSIPVAPGISINNMGFPNDWQNLDLWK